MNSDHGYTEQGKRLSSLLDSYFESIGTKNAINSLVSAKLYLKTLHVPVACYDVFDHGRVVSKNDLKKFRESANGQTASSAK